MSNTIKGESSGLCGLLPAGAAGMVHRETVSGGGKCGNRNPAGHDHRPVLEGSGKSEEGN